MTGQQAVLRSQARHHLRYNQTASSFFKGSHASSFEVLRHLLLSLEPCTSDGHRDRRRRDREHVPKWLEIGHSGRCQIAITEHLACNCCPPASFDQFNVIVQDWHSHLLRIMEALYIKCDQPSLWNREIILSISIFCGDVLNFSHLSSLKLSLCLLPSFLGCLWEDQKKLVSSLIFLSFLLNYEIVALRLFHLGLLPYTP